MADKRNIRRDAERKAREALGGDLVTTVGDLAMATAERTAASAALAVARTRGDELIATAKQQADKLAADAQLGIDAVEDEYGKAYTAARDAGWTTTQLKGLGYTRPATRKTNDGAANSEQDGTPPATAEPAPDLATPAAS